ncbi:protein LURP-one-related 5-like [Fagus crenata]
MNKVVIVDEKFCFPGETQLTVHKTSLFFPGDGFIVYDPKGEILFRFDSYGPESKPKDELVLMDSSGKCLLTLLRKKPSLRQRWEGYIGEKAEHQDPILSVCRSSIIGRSSLVVEVYGDPDEEYQIEGSYPQRCCKIYIEKENSSKEAVAEIKRKVDPSTKVMLGKDVFLLCLKPVFDSAFAMGLVLILDQMYGDDVDDDAQEVDPTLEDSSS